MFALFALFILFIWFILFALFALLEDYTSTEESGAEDSDEDIITDYLSPLDDNGNLDAAVSATRILSPGAASAATGATISSRFFDSDDTTDSPAVRISAEMEAAGAAAAAATAGCDGTTTRTSSDDPTISANNYATTAESIPIISVTQHSPAASKAFFILGTWSFPFSVFYNNDRLVFEWLGSFFFNFLLG